MKSFYLKNSTTFKPLSSDSSFFPGGSQEVLLQVIFGPQSAQCWQKWMDRRDIDDLDYPAYRLLPLLLSQRSDLSALIPSRIKGFHRFCWTRNQVRLMAVRELLQAFDDEVIPVLAYKDLALVLNTYPNVGARPLEEVDLYVRTEDLGRAAACLQKLGWSTEFSPQQMTIRASTLIASGKFEIRLGCNFVGAIPVRQFRNEIWEHRREVMLEGSPFFAPCLSDQLFLLLLRAVHFSEKPSWEWVPDSLMILQQPTASAPDFWAHFCELSGRYSCNALVFDALAYLQNRWQAPVPAEVLSELCHTPLKRIYQWEHANHHRPASQWTRLTALLAAHARLVQLGEADEKMSLLSFWLLRRGLQSTGEISDYLKQKLGAKLSRH